MSPVLRAYSSDDRGHCLRIFDSNCPRYFAECERDQFESFLDSSGCPYYVVERPGSIVGCGGYAIQGGGKPANLCWGMIDGTCHRQGLGQFLLLGRLQAIITSESVTTVRLDTSQFTEGFFARFGFIVTARMADGYSPGLDQVEMRLVLTNTIRLQLRESWRKASGTG